MILLELYWKRCDFYTKGGLKSMTRKENLSLKRRNLVVVLLAFVLVISSMLAGCSSAKTEEGKDAATTVQAEISEVEQEIFTETAVANTDITEEAIVENVQYETPEAWVESLQLEEPSIVIWNSHTMENTVLQENQEYQLKENDHILLTLGGRMNSFNCNPMDVFKSFEPFEQLYLDISLDIVGKQDIAFEFDVNGEMYTKAATFIAAPSDVET